MAVLQQWGSDLAVRIPARLVKELKLHPGNRVELAIRDASIVITCCRPKYRLRDLLKNCQPHQLHGETRFGPDVGREVLD